MKYEVRYNEWKTCAAYVQAYKTTDDEKYCDLYDANVTRKKAEAVGNDPREAAENFYNELTAAGATLVMLNEYAGYLKTADGRAISSIDVNEAPRTIYGHSVVSLAKV